MNKFFRFCVFLNGNAKEFPLLRSGQNCMNSLYEFDPETYKEVVYTDELDCFYEDSKIMPLCSYLFNRWKDE